MSGISVEVPKTFHSANVSCAGFFSLASVVPQAVSMSLSGGEVLSLGPSKHGIQHLKERGKGEREMAFPRTVLLSC